MINEYTREYRAKGDGVNVVEVRVYYALGGYNYFTYRNEPRGYYFSLSPYEVKDGWRSYTAFSGVKECILECSRQSRSRFEKAKAMATELIDERLQRFCEENGIELVSDEYFESERERKVS